MSTLRWLILKDNFIGYIRPEDGELSDVMLMDSQFKVSCGISQTGAKHGVLIENLSRFVIYPLELLPFFFKKLVLHSQ